MANELSKGHGNHGYFRVTRLMLGQIYDGVKAIGWVVIEGDMIAPGSADVRRDTCLPA